MILAESYWPLAFGLLLIAAFGSWVFIHSHRSYLLRWALIPLSLMVAAASAKVYDARLGYAVPAGLPTEFVYLGHEVVVERNHKTGIEIWARAARTRLYRIEYSRRMEASLEAARDQAKGGLPVVMRRQEPEGKGRATSRASDPGEALYQSNVMLPSEINPKS